MQIARQIFGEFYFKLTVEGKSTHICNKHQAIYPSPPNVDLLGVNAIDKAIKVLHVLHDLENQWGIYQNSRYMPPGSMTLNFSKIQGGENFSSLAGTCELVGSVLFNPELTSRDVIQEIQQVIDSLAHRDYWFRKHPPSFEVPYKLDIKEPVDVSSDNQFMKALIRSYSRVCSKDPELKASVGTSDGNYLNQKGVTPLELGLATNRNHSANERISIDNLINLTKIFAHTILDICAE